MSAVRPAWMEKPRPVTQAAKGLALIAVVLLVCVPFLVIVSTSLASTDEVVANGGWVLWPQNPTLKAYRDIAEGGIVTHALGVSAGVTVVGTLLSLFCTVTLAYALSRPGTFGSKPVLLLVLFTFLFPPGMIPSFLLVQGMGLLDSYASLVLPVLINVFNLVVLRGFFQSVPEELYEAAKLDGAGDWRVLWSVVLPLSKAALAVVGLFYAVAYWNSWFYASRNLLERPVVAPAGYAPVVARSGLTDTSESSLTGRQAVQVTLGRLPILLVYRSWTVSRSRPASLARPERSWAHWSPAFASG